MNSVIIHYHEIALKGRNRPWFIKHLVQNLRDVLAGLDVKKVRALMGRIEVVLGPSVDWEEARERIDLIFGIANFSRARRSSRDIDNLTSGIINDLVDHDVSSFRVTARRADKTYPLKSPEIERLVGASVQADRGWRVDLKNPALIIYIEVLSKEAFYSLERYSGRGGLPSGTSGSVMCLLSGGIDSPVAAYRMMKRGCRVRCVHFHSYPLLSHASKDKVREIMQHLTRHQLVSRLYMVAFGEIQKLIMLSAPPALRVVLYRRLMMRIAERLARTTKSQALVTGEAVGQVASQTLENLAVINDSVTLPVLRPLVGSDKEEISREAQAIGTYPISIIPDQDCCQLFIPRNPTTRARLADVETVEEALPITAIIESAVTNAEEEDFKYPSLHVEARNHNKIFSC
jgi:thiamine biosynthesis protein ThiI